MTGLDLFISLVFFQESTPPDLVIFLGRFHPLLVHLPISFILLALLLEVLTKFKRFAELKPANSFVLLLGATSSLLAVGAGYLLSLSGDYGEDLLWWHKWSGIAVAITALGAYLIKSFSKKSSEAFWGKAYASLLGISGALLIFASHYGGSLTHGSDYLIAYMPEPMRSWAGMSPRERPSKEIHLVNVDEAQVYEELIAPILDSKCTSCHNSNKKKGDLILTSRESILAGGEGGTIINSGDSERSELFRRITLDPNDEKYMPPDGRKPLPDEHIELIRWWIDEGAPFDANIASLNSPEEIRLILDAMSNPSEAAFLDQEISPADQDAIQAISESGILILPLSQETNFLQAQFLNIIDSYSEEHLDLLLPISTQLTWLDLGRSPVSDNHMKVIGQLKNLTKLHLEKTSISDDGLVHLKELQHLEYLNLYGTSITDNGLAHLHSLGNLKSLYLWQTDVTKDGVEELQLALPNLYVNTGWEEPTYSD